MTTILMHWLTGFAAFVLATLHPAPHHAVPQHHQPVRLPELARLR